MEVDSFRYVPSLIKRYYQLNRVRRELPIPFTPLPKPLLVTPMRNTARKTTAQASIGRTR
jgi:hypothetical protein